MARMICNKGFSEGPKNLTKHTLHFYDTGRLWVFFDCHQITQIQQSTTSSYTFVPKVRYKCFSRGGGGGEASRAAGENYPKAYINDSF